MKHLKTLEQAVVTDQKGRILHTSATVEIYLCECGEQLGRIPELSYQTEHNECPSDTGLLNEETKERA